MSVLKVATVFSGIGAAEQALKKLNIKNKIIFACDTGERYLNDTKEDIINLFEASSSTNLQKFIKEYYENNIKRKNYVKETYFNNYDISEDRWYEDIRFIDGKKYKNNVDLFIGGSPCQSFSIIGKKAGLNDTRGTLFYEFARLIDEIQPKSFIFENVEGLLSYDKGKTWKVIKDVFDSLGYNYDYSVINSKDFGIPQSRKRLFVIGTKSKNKILFPKPIELKKITKDYLENNVETRHYLGKKGFEFVTNPKYKNRARVNRDIIMCQKANQQFNWNGDFVFEKLNLKKHNKEILERAHIGCFHGVKGVIRQLSYRECHRLMGFDDSFKITAPNVQAYRQAGNSIVVDVLMEIIKCVMEVSNVKNSNCI